MIITPLCNQMRTKTKQTGLNWSCNRNVKGLVEAPWYGYWRIRFKASLKYACPYVSLTFSTQGNLQAKDTKVNDRLCLYDSLHESNSTVEEDKRLWSIEHIQDMADLITMGDIDPATGQLLSSPVLDTSPTALVPEQVWGALTERYYRGLISSGGLMIEDCLKMTFYAWYHNA